MSSDIVSNLDSAITLARESAQIEQRITEIEHPDDPGTKVPVVLETATDKNGQNETRVALASEILTELDKRTPGPRRRVCVVALTEPGSFVEYVRRYQNADTVVYANTKAMAFVAVLDEHPAGPVAAGSKPGAATAWREHRASYSCPKSPEWITWSALDGKAMKQDEFADFLEQRLEDLVIAEGMPKPIEMLKVARELHIRTKGTFQREVNPTTGDFILVNKNETETGSTVIPRAFALAIPVFEGGERYKVEARVRFQLTGSGPMFSFTMHRRAEIERDAFDGVRQIIATGTERPVYAGTP
jgi:uncharacterized protein YfdQ (DUF2303 family)